MHEEAKGEKRTCTTVLYCGLLDAVTGVACVSCMKKSKVKKVEGSWPRMSSCSNDEVEMLEDGELMEEGVQQLVLHGKSSSKTEAVAANKEQ